MQSSPGLTILWALLLAIFCHGGPINRQSEGLNNLRLDSRNQSYTEQNVCVNDDVLYQPGDLMPAPNPCSRCVCNPPSSKCTPVSCQKKPGCKALQRPNQCCPEYQCECEWSGRVYQNGERLDNAEKPCEACYCQGGEVVCTTVECYRRADCEPQFVPGRCCPKYDHCPPLVMDDVPFSESHDKTRPQHTRSTFQPSSTAPVDNLASPDEKDDNDDDDQDIGASQVDERVHTDKDDASDAASTTSAPLHTESDKESDKESSDFQTVPPATPGFDPIVNTQQPIASDPQDSDVEVRLHAPEVPSSEENADAETTTAGLGTTVSEDVDTLTDVEIKAKTNMETNEGSGDVSEVSPTEQSPSSETAETEDPAKEDVRSEVPQTEMSEFTTQGGIESTAWETNTDAVSRNPDEDNTDDPLLQRSAVEEAKANEEEKEGTEEPSTVSTKFEDLTTPASAFTDAFEEMSTTIQALPKSKDDDVEGGPFGSTESFEITTESGDSFHSLESSTDNAPPISSLDEMASKSSEFQRDNSYVGSSDVRDSSGSSDSSSSIKDHSSQILATNINTEIVKLSPERDGSFESNSFLDNGKDSIGSTESVENTESLNLAENHNQSETENSSENVSGTERSPNLAQNVDSSAENQSVKKLGELNITENASPNSEEKVSIVLDEEATDEDGPPILLIGDDIANHQMDIVVATSRAEPEELATEDIPKEVVLNENQDTFEEDKTKDSSYAGTDATTTISAESETTTSVKDVLFSNTKDYEKVSVRELEEDQSSEIGKEHTTTNPVTELEGSYTTEVNRQESNSDAIPTSTEEEKKSSTDDIMMSDSHLSGADNEQNMGNIKRIDNLESTEESDQFVQIHVENFEVNPRTTLRDDSMAQTSEPEIKELRTEYPEQETTTNNGYTDTYVGKEDESTDTVSTPSDVFENNQEEQRSDEKPVEETPIDSATTEVPKERAADLDGATTNVNDQTEMSTVPATPASVNTFVTETDLIDIMKADEGDSESLAHLQLKPLTQIPDNENKKSTESTHFSERSDEETTEKIVLVEGHTTVQYYGNTAVPDEITSQASETSTEIKEMTSQYFHSEDQPQNDGPAPDTNSEEQKGDKEDLSKTLIEETQSSKNSLQDISDEEDPSNSDVPHPTENHQEATEDNPNQIRSTMVQEVKVAEDAPSTETEIPEQSTETEKMTNEDDDMKNETRYKIIQSVLELKVSTLRPEESSKGTLAPAESDMSTLSPEWLKSDNQSRDDSAVVASHGDSEGMDASQSTDAPRKGETELLQVIDDQTVPSVLVTTEAPLNPTTLQDVLAGHTLPTEGESQKRSERDSTDKKDLNILEDFFTKLYRPQIATDATKH